MSSEPSASARIGQVLKEKWTIERLLGAGGMASVYAARHRNGRAVAVKMLHPEMSQRADVRERFRREGYASNKVGHRGAVEIFDDDVAEDGSAFLVMELLEGESLTERANRGNIEMGDLLGIAEEILDVLVNAHEQGIVHRDLKPDNIFLTRDGRVKLLDFGIARVADAMPSSFRTRTGTAIGTGPYMSPEQAAGRLDIIDGRADLFSLGATMFRIIARRKIHEMANDADLLVAMSTMPAPPLASVARHAPHGVSAIVDRALAFLPGRRYPDARTMQMDVQAVRRGELPPFATQQSSMGIEPWVTREPVVSSEARTVPERPGAGSPEQNPHWAPPVQPGPPLPGPNLMTPPPAAVAVPPIYPAVPTPLAAPPSARYDGPSSSSAASSARVPVPTVVSARPPAKAPRLVVWLAVASGVLVLGLLGLVLWFAAGASAPAVNLPPPSASRVLVPIVPAPSAVAPPPTAVPANAPPKAAPGKKTERAR